MSKYAESQPAWRFLRAPFSLPGCLYPEHLLLTLALAHERAWDLCVRSPVGFPVCARYPPLRTSSSLPWLHPWGLRWCLRCHHVCGVPRDANRMPSLGLQVP